MQGSKVARDVMVRDLITLAPQMVVFDGCDLLLRHQISGAPVVDESHKLLGVFSEKDCLRVLVNAAYEQLPTTRINAFLQADCQTVEEDTDLLTIAQLFLNNSYRRLPVVRDGKLVGQISRRDVLRAVNSVEVPHGEPRHARLLYLSSLVPIDDAPFS